MTNKVEKQDRQILREIERHAQGYPLLEGSEEVLLISTYQSSRNKLYKRFQDKYGFKEPQTWLSEGEKLCVSQLLDSKSKFYSPKAKNSYDKLILSNLKLVKSEALKRQGGTLSTYDLFVEGMLGLSHAIDKFDISKKNQKGNTVKLSTYATLWIKQYQQRAVQDKGRTIRIPIHVHDQINRLRKIYGQMATDNYDRPAPSSVELAKAAGMSREQVEMLGAYIFPIGSTDEWTNEEQTETLSTNLSQEEKTQPEVVAEVSEDNAYLKELLATLGPEDSKFFALFYGLVDGRSRTVKELASAYGIKRDDILAREKKCMDKLKAVADRKRVNLLES